MKSQYIILALQKITNLAFVYKWTCREEMRGWDHYWISGPSSAIIGAAYMGYMDITFPHGCIWINLLELGIPAKDEVKLLVSVIFLLLSVFKLFWVNNQMLELKDGQLR